MKKLILFLLLLPFALTGQNVYFVATDGNDVNLGTISEPFLTIQHGINQLDAGDTLYLRGGVYYITSRIIVDASGQYHSHSHGTEANPIVVSAYPPDHAAGNVAIIDGINAWRANNIWIKDISWWKFWGITSRHALQDGDAQQRIGFLVSRAMHIYLEQCVAHNNGGSGFYAEQNGTIAHFINCDSYNNADTLFNAPNIAGGMARGFAGVGPITLGEGEESNFEVYMAGNRAWDNSDNAFEGVYTIGKLRMENNWAIRAGRAVGNLPRGDGRSFVAGLSYDIPPPNDQYIIKNNIAAYGKAWGFNVNSRQRPYQINAQYYNNLDIKCNSGWVVRRSANEKVSWTFNVPGELVVVAEPEYELASGTQGVAYTPLHGSITDITNGVIYSDTRFILPANVTEEIGEFSYNDGGIAYGAIMTNPTDLIFKNNISYGQPKKITNQTMVDWEYDTEFAHDYNWRGITFTSDFNTWNDSDMHLTEADFVGPIDSLSLVTAMLAPRKSDGSLPDLPNLMPSESSQLRDAGTDVGLPYEGTAPDLGPFEYVASGEPPPTGDILLQWQDYTTFTPLFGAVQTTTLLNAYNEQWDSIQNNLDILRQAVEAQFDTVLTWDNSAITYLNFSMNGLAIRNAINNNNATLFLNMDAVYQAILANHAVPGYDDIEVTIMIAPTQQQFVGLFNWNIGTLIINTTELFTVLNTNYGY